jgi:hypothetical protein
MSTRTSVKFNGMFCHGKGLPTVVHWFHSLVSLMYSHTLMEMTSLADMHPFADVGTLLMLWFLLAVAHPSLLSER